MTTATEPTTPAAIGGMTPEDVLSWYATDPANASAYATAFGFAIDDPRTLLGGMSAAQLADLHAANPYASAQYLANHNIDRAAVERATKEAPRVVTAKTPQETFVELMKVNPFAGAAYGEAHGLIKSGRSIPST